MEEEFVLSVELSRQMRGLMPGQCAFHKFSATL